MAGDVQRQITRKCKLSSLLNQPYKQYRQEVPLYCVCFWVENGFRDDTAYPDVMSEIFWSHCYRTVARDEGHVVRSVTFSV
ncbi:hypothetical protein AB4K20DRAFT_1955178 [Rhizopus microsporus]